MILFNKLETKIPPPVYGLLTAISIWWMDKLFPAFSLLPSTVKPLGIVIMLCGFCLDLIALMQFTRQHTSVNPLHPDKAHHIVINGLYHYTRNPMYLGMLIALCGWSIYIGNIVSFACLPAFVWLLTRIQIQPEERILAEKFGQPYTDYLKQVRRWI